jgi:hypothetical protein
MSVTLSLFAGAGAQFLDNSGNVLTGGLVYSYAAGTTTPLATYTSNTGATPHSNPIILDAAGRVPGGEIWMTAESSYKFVLKDANNVLIGTYDNISINQNFTNITYTGTLIGGSASFTNITYSGALTGGSASVTNSAYSGTLTGGTGIANIGSGQIYKAVDGKVGVGTTTPITNFHVNGGAIQVPVLVSSTGSGSFAYFRDANTTGTYGPAIGSTGDNLIFTRYGVAEYMRVDSNGNVLIGTTSTPFAGGNGLTVKATTGASIGVIQTLNGGAPTYAWTTGPDGTGNYCVINNTFNGVYVVYGGTAWTATSDERLKTDLKPIDNALDKVNGLRSVTGRFKTDEESKSRSFLIAQDVQKVFPEAVEASNPDKLGVQYTDVIPLLVAAIKELNEKIVKLEAK